MTAPLRLDGVRLPLPDFELAADAELGASFTLLTGRSGSGKSTLLEVIAGLRRAASGRIALGRRLLADAPAGVDLPSRQRRLGYAPQDDTVFPHLSVAHNLAYGRARGEGPVPREELLEELGLNALLNRRPRRLSGGERRRVAIARALLPSSDLVLLDEPLTGLDAELRSRVVHLAARVAGAGVPVLFVTHDPDELDDVPHERLTMERGRLIHQHPC